MNNKEPEWQTNHVILGEKKVSSKVGGRLLCGSNYLFLVTSIQCMRCSGKADHYNSHSNTKAAIKLNYNSKVKKKKKIIVNAIKSIKLCCDKGERGNPEPSTTTLVCAYGRN